MRLDKFLSNMGLGSRRDVHKLISSGSVEVDGNVITERDAKISETFQKVYVNGSFIPYKPFIYIMVNKPAGYLSSTEDGSGPVVTDLLSDVIRSYRPGVAGRLDKDAEGLLLLTNDGPFIHRVITPDKNVIKKYLVKLSRGITRSDVVQFEKGIRLSDGTQLKPAGLREIQGDGYFAEVSISEGKFHQVKRMFLSVGNEVTYLKRLSIGGLVLDGSLEPGEYKELSSEEAKKAYEQTDC